MSVQNWYHDGYSREDGFIKEEPRLYNALRFKWRPVTVQQRSVVYRLMDDAVAANDPNKAESISADAMVRALISWDLKDQNGKDVPISVANVLRLQPNLGVRLFRILMGREAPDEDSIVTPAAREAQVQDALTAAFGKSPEEEDAKNSPPGSG